MADKSLHDPTSADCLDFISCHSHYCLLCSISYNHLPLPVAKLIFISMCFTCFVCSLCLKLSLSRSVQLAPSHLFWHKCKGHLHIEIFPDSLSQSSLSPSRLFIPSFFWIFFTAFFHHQKELIIFLGTCVICVYYKECPWV